MARPVSGKRRKQIAALPIALAADGVLRLLVITSRETKRFIVPKGWPMRGVEDHRVAEIEALEEAGLNGRAYLKPLGSYHPEKRHTQGCEPVRVKVYLLHVDGQLATWKEKGQREMAWFDVEEAATLLDERGLAELVLDLPRHLPKSWLSRVSTAFSVDAGTGAQDDTSTDMA